VAYVVILLGIWIDKGLEIYDNTSWKIEDTTGAGRILELKPSTLCYRMKKLGIRRP